jgi:hypothetical protein
MPDYCERTWEHVGLKESDYEELWYFISPVSRLMLKSELVLFNRRFFRCCVFTCRKIVMYVMD